MSSTQLLMMLLLLVTVSMPVVQAYIVLRDKAYVQLNDFNGGHTLNASTSNRMAFDSENNILYIIATEPARMTVFDMALDGTPTLKLEHTFSTATQGHPLDVEFCRPLSGFNPPGRLAVTFRAPSNRAAVGKVWLYKPLTRDDTQLTKIKDLAVKAEPVDIEFAADCTVMLVANQGRPSLDGNTYRDPEGSITKIFMPLDVNENSVFFTTTLNFDWMFTSDESGDYLGMLEERNFRFVPRQSPAGALTVMQSIEPQRLIVAPNGYTGYVTLPKNNAVARLNLDTNLVSTIIALGNRSWTDYYMDASDADGEANMRAYDIYSMMQPTELAWISKDEFNYIAMLDTGRKEYIPDYDFADHERASVLMANGDIIVEDSRLQDQLRDDTELGRLWVSTTDGQRLIDGRIEKVFTFGGRGFSIHDGISFDLQTGVIDGIEQVTKQFYRDIFNTDMVNASSTPVLDAEATSTSYGPNLGAMAVGEINNKIVVFMGSASSGILYVYQLSPDADCPQPVFHSVHRAGNSTAPWDQAYEDGSIGDIGITDMLFLSGENREQVIAVTSATSNSLSIYTVYDGPFSPEDA